MEESEQKSTEQLWKEFLDSTDKQLEINAQLKDIAERFAGTSSKRKGPVLTEEVADQVRDLFVKLEASLGEQRAVYHSLFGIEE